MSYDAATKQWTILREGTFDGKYLVKRLTVRCSLFQWGNREPDRGPDACHLQVGRLIVLNPLPPPDKRSQFLLVDETVTESLVITEGDGDDKTMQLFDILKYEVLPDRASQ